ncbi:MAG: diphosphomevalonate decarboxylase [Bdellovibrionales bacterium]|nr:diphosphomevalonate decarboxylase [Bdellovibrionales bacterium]
MKQSFQASAPSNIALIKYMGKLAAETGSNRPANSSISFSLNGFKTHVRASVIDGVAEPFVWAPLRKAGLQAPHLSEHGRMRFLQHAERVMKRIGAGLPNGKSILIESANDFPSDCGLASSASSFAALTMAIAGLFESKLSVEDLADISREGSGSSCRSFFIPWGIWDSEGARAAEGLPGEDKLWHMALIVDDSLKRVSSSEAHKRVASSLLFRGRPERAEERLRQLMDCLRRASGNDGVHAWNRASELVWAESWDMHVLFETSEPSFGYMVPESLRVLSLIRELNLKYAESETYRKPLVTLDAGPNVHVIGWRDAQSEQMKDELMARVRSFARVEDGVR